MEGKEKEESWSGLKSEREGERSKERERRDGKSGLESG